MPTKCQIACSILTMTSISDARTANKKAVFRGCTYKLLAIAYLTPVVGATLAIAKRIHLYLFYNDKINGLTPTSAQKEILLRGIRKNLANMVDHEFLTAKLEALQLGKKVIGYLPDAWERMWTLNKSEKEQNGNLVVSYSLALTQQDTTLKAQIVNLTKEEFQQIDRLIQPHLNYPHQYTLDSNNQVSPNQQKAIIDGILSQIKKLGNNEMVGNDHSLLDSTSKVWILKKDPTSNEYTLVSEDKSHFFLLSPKDSKNILDTITQCENTVT